MARYMKHIIILQGKRFISSKRASNISGYSSDYIGQLCRAKKIDGKMVGHAWFVDQDSLEAHMASSAAPEAFRDRHQNFNKIKNQAQQTKSERAADISDAGRISSKEAAVKYGYTNDYLGQLCRAGKLDGRMFGNTWFITEASLVAHKERIENAAREKESQAVEMKPSAVPSTEIKDSNAKRTDAAMAAIKSAPAIYAAPSAFESSGSIRSQNALVLSPAMSKPAAVKSEPSPASVSSFVRTAYIAAIAVALVISVGMMSLALFGSKPSSVSNRPLTAGVYAAAESALSFLGSEYRALVALIFGGSAPVAVAPKAAPAQADGYAPSEGGIAVMPTSGSSDVDEERKQKIKDSFSDEVVVKPDQSGTSGVITPVFRQSAGKDYVYVMVPVKNASPP